MFNPSNDSTSYEAMPGLKTGELSEEQQKTADTWAAAMAEMPPFQGDNSESYKEMPGIDESVADAGTDIGELSEALQDATEDSAEDGSDTPDYLVAFQQGNVVTTSAARETVSGASGIGTEALRDSLQAQGFNNSDIIRSVNLNASAHRDAERAAYVSDNTDEAKDQADAAMISTAVTENAIKATAESEEVIKAARLGDEIEAKTHLAGAETALQYTLRLVAAAKAASRFVDNPGLSSRLNASFQEAEIAARQAVDKARNAITALQAGEQIPDSDLHELTPEENLDESAETDDNVATEANATEEVSAEAISQEPAPQSEQLNPDMLGENPVAEQQKPSTEQESAEQPKTNSIFDSAAAEEALSSINPFSQAVKEITEQQGENIPTIEQLGNSGNINSPSAASIENSLKLDTNYDN